MRWFIYAVIVLLLATPSVQAGPASDSRRQLQEVNEEILKLDKELVNARESEEKLAAKIIEFQEELVTNRRTKDELISESRRLEVELAPLEKVLADLLVETAQQGAQAVDTEEQLQRAVVESYQEPASWWQTLMSFNLRETLQNRSLRNYWVFAASKAYAASQNAYSHLNEEQLELKRTVELKQDKLAAIENELSSLTERDKQISDHLEEEKNKLQEVRQEIGNKDRMLLQALGHARRVESELATGIMGASFPTRRGEVIGWPLSIDGQLTSDYGYRIHPIFNDRRFHTGVDFAAPSGTPIEVVADGVVTASENMGGYGLSIVVDHGGGISTMYAHASRLIARPGQTVRKGDTIALVGNTGYSTGPHLHFEVRENGEHVNPWIWLR